MSVQDIREALENAMARIVEEKEKYVDASGAFTRERKCPLLHVLRFCITKGAKSTGNEIEEFYEWSQDCPTESAVLQQRKKLRAEAFAALLRYFAMALLMLFGPPEKFHMIAVDGTGVSFMNPTGTENDVWRKNAKNGRPIGHAHVTMLYDVVRKIFLDAVIQPVHRLDERAAFVEMIERFVSPWKHLPVIFTADRGFPSWNMAAHIIKSSYYFLIRMSDATVRGSQLVQLMPAVPSSGYFDMWVSVRIVRKRSKDLGFDPKTGKMVIYVADKFDFADKASDEFFDMRIRVSRFQLHDGSWECVMTNLPKTRYPFEKLAALYWMRWSIEGGIKGAKSPLAMESLSSRKPQLVMQDILGTLIACNVVAAIVCVASDNLAEEDSDSGRQYEQAIDFSHAVGACRQFLRHPDEWSDERLMRCMRRHTHCVRPKRPAPPRGKPRKRGVVPFTGRAS